VLAKERRRISVYDICAALEENDDTSLGDYEGTPLGKDVVLPVWEHAYQQTMDHLKQVNLAILCEQALAQNIRKEGADKMDFAI
jgi:DNA-binding IscR family transcriptional regulator